MRLALSVYPPPPEFLSDSELTVNLILYFHFRLLSTTFSSVEFPSFYVNYY